MDISHFNKISNTDNVLQRLDGRVKTVLFICAIITVTTFTHWYLVAGLWLIAIVSFGILQLSLSNLIKRLLIPFGIAWLVLLNMLFTNGIHPLWTIAIGPISLTAYHEGLQLGILILLRIMAAITLATVLSFSTPMVEILGTFRLCKVPSIIIDLADMMYRYVFIILETSRNMRHAQLSRMGDSASWLQQTRDVGKLACYVLIKSIDRSIKIYNSMLSRGYNEDSIVSDYFTKPIPRTDLYLGFLVIVLLVVLIIINIII